MTAAVTATETAAPLTAAAVAGHVNRETRNALAVQFMDQELAAFHAALAAEYGDRLTTFTLKANYGPNPDAELTGRKVDGRVVSASIEGKRTGFSTARYTGAFTLRVQVGYGKAKAYPLNAAGRFNHDKAAKWVAEEAAAQVAQENSRLAAAAASEQRADAAAALNAKFGLTYGGRVEAAAYGGQVHLGLDLTPEKMDAALAALKAAGVI